MVSALAAALNHLLQGNGWARDLLLPHAGKVAQFRCPPFETRLAVRDDGQLAVAAPDATPAVELTLTPGLLLRAAARDDSAWRDVIITGDTALAAAIHQLWRHLRWDVEEDLSRAFGDIAAHRMVDTGRAARRWVQMGGENLARASAEYWTEEQPVIAARTEVTAFNAAVDTLRDDVARLEKRIEQLNLRR